MKKLLSLFCFISLSASCMCQSLTHTQIRSLSDRIMKTVLLTDGNYDSTRKSEYIQCLFTTDSIGKIVSMRLLADPSNLGDTYNIISKIPISSFSDWQAETAKNKTIVFTIVMVANYNPCPAYILHLIRLDVPRHIYLTIDSETDHIIFLTPYIYNQANEPRA